MYLPNVLVLNESVTHLVCVYSVLPANNPNAESDTRMLLVNLSLGNLGETRHWKQNKHMKYNEGRSNNQESVRERTKQTLEKILIQKKMFSFVDQH